MSIRCAANWHYSMTRVALILKRAAVERLRVKFGALTFFNISHKRGHDKEGANFIKDGGRWVTWGPFRPR